MTITIDPGEDDREDIARKYGATVGRESLRTSNARRLRLQKASQRRSRDWDLSLSIDPDHPTAHVDQSPDTGPEVVVTGRAIDQPVTGLAPTDWDYAAQRALSWHEDGHVLYTDHDDMMERLGNLDRGDKGTAKEIWNCLEDAAIELQICRRWSNAYPVLRALRANLFEGKRADDGSSEGPGINDVERGGRVFPVVHAIHSVLMDRWMQEVYEIDLGLASKLLDPDDEEYHFATENDRTLFVNNIEPEIEAVIPDVLSTADPVDRNARIFEFVEAVLPDVDAADGDGKSQMNRDEQESASGMPDDATEGHTGEAQADARELDDVDPDDVGEGGNVLVPGQGQQGQPVDVSDVDVAGDVSERIADVVASDRREEAGLSEDVLDELEEMAAAADGDLDDEILVADEPWDADRHSFERAKRGSGPIARILRNRLQQERVSETKRRQRRGRFTGRGGASARAARGESEIKQREAEPEDKDYEFMFVLDRSGSMSGRAIEHAEIALGMLALALEDVGVDVSILELYGNEARLAKPFGVPVSESKERLFNHRTSGGTPLSGALRLARSRLLQEADAQTCMVVVTDGSPADPDEFEAAIAESPMPTIGVNIGSDGAGMDTYDRSVAATPGENLSAVLQALVQEVMF